MGGRRGRRRDVVELHVEVHPHLTHLLGEFPHDGDRVGVLVDPRHETEGQVAVDDNLLDIDEIGAVRGENGADTGGDARTVGAGDGEECRGSGGAHGCS